MNNRTTRVLSGLLIASLAAVGTALISQYQFGMQPCAWCVLQRLIFLLIGAAAALALVLRLPWFRAIFSGLIVVLAGGGIASALYQHFVASRSSSCGLSLAEKIVGTHLHLDELLPSVFGIRASCSDAATNLLGIPYEFWSCALFVIMAGVAAVTAVRVFSPARAP